MYCLLVFLKFRGYLSTSDNYPEELIQSLENDQISDNLTYFNLDTQEVIMNEQRMTENYQIYSDFPSINLQTDGVGNNYLNSLHNANINYDGIFDLNDHTGLQKQSNNKNEIGFNSIQNNNTKIIRNSVNTDFDMGLDESEHECKSLLSRNQTKRCHNKKKSKCKMHVQDSQLTINKESSKNKVKHFRRKLKFLTLPPNLEILDISKFNKSEDTDYLDKIQVENGEKNCDIFDESKKNEQNLILKRKRNNLSYKKAIGKRNENDQMVNSGILTFDLKKLEEKNLKTFQGRGKLDENKRIDLDLFEKINIVKLIKDLEDEFPIRFNKIYHHLTSEEFPKKCFSKQSECSKEDFETLLNFTNKYIFNKTLRTVFMRENDKLSYSYVFKKSKKDMISKILKQFNLTMKNFVEDLEKFYLKRCENYFQPLKIIFFTKNKNILRKKLIWFFEMFLKSPKMKIITYLFPEIHLFIDELRKDKCVRILYKKIHLIISLFGFRTYLLSENLKHVFDSNKLNPSFVFTDSNFVNFFVFEMRCFLCLCGFKVLKEKTAIRFLLYKTFISFIRISNIDVFRGTKFDDYISYKDFMDLGIFQNVKLKKIRKPNDIYTEGTCYKIRTLLKTDFDKFLKLKDKSMQTRFSKKNDELKEYYENTIFENKIQKITHKIFQYFERIN